MLSTVLKPVHTTVMRDMFKPRYVQAN